MELIIAVALASCAPFYYMIGFGFGTGRREAPKSMYLKYPMSWKIVRQY